MKHFSCLLLLVSCRGFIPATTSKSKIRTNGQNPPFNFQQTIAAEIKTTLLLTKDVSDGSVNTNPATTKLSFWKTKVPKSWWKERVLLEDLKVGQEISGHVVQEYLEAKTGPKLYFECGVGRKDRNGDWSIVNGMLRLDRGKASVARKRAERFRKKDRVQLFVSRVQKECGRLEVCAKIDDLERYTGEPKTSVATLKKNQEVTGVVVKLYPYGAIIDIGANVNGLLHITKVASVMNRYVDKEKGLKSAGLEKGAKVRLMVESVEKRRLSLDFTDDVKEEAKEEARKEKMDKEEPKILEQQLVDEYDYSPNNDDVEAWAEYANQGALNEKEDEEEVGSSSIDDDYDDKYDEEFDIESNLGLDMY
jgi:predicted RNA-binding protein with RPS1 domain